MPNINNIKKILFRTREEVVSGPTTLYYENFGTSGGEYDLPTGWSASPGSEIFIGDNAGLGIPQDSTGYEGASGGYAVLYSDTNNGEVLTLDASISTTGLSDLTLSLGVYKVSGAGKPTVEYDADGGGWTSITYTDVTADSTWRLLTISLPVGCEDASALKLRWTFTNTDAGFLYLIDDVKITY